MHQALGFGRAVGGGAVETIVGTANQITVTPSTGDVVISIPSVFIAPGSITATTSVTATTVFLAGNGTAAAPAYSFTSDTDTGFYFVSANIIGVASNGVEAFRFSHIGSTATIQQGAAGGAVQLTDAGALAFVAGGTNQSITLTPSGTGNIQTISGTAAAPSYSFTSEPDCGLYVSAANEVSMSLGGTRSFSFGTAGQFYGAQGNNKLDMPSTGALSLVAAGTNQSITLTPSGTGTVSAGPSTLTNQIMIGAQSDATTYGVLSFNGVMSGAGRMGFSGGGGTDKVFYSNVATGGSFRWQVNNVADLVLATSGNLLLGGLTTDGTGVLQFQAATTSAGGITFGTDTNFYRAGAGGVVVLASGAGAEASLNIDAGAGTFSADIFLTARSAGSSTQGNIKATTAGALTFAPSGTIALTLDSSQNASFAGNVVVQNLFRSNSGGSVANPLFGLNTSNGPGMYFTTTTAATANLVLVTNAAAALTIDTSQNVTAAGNLKAGTNNQLGWASGTAFQQAADGVIKILDNAGTSFGRLQFGGTTASFPALKRSTTVLQARLADDSGFATFQGNFTGTAGTAGLTQASTTTLGKSITVENGLITAFA